MSDILENFSTIKLESPVDVIIKRLKEMISSGILKPGDRLPAERILAEKFGIGRSYVRQAIMKLEFYGMLKTLPQSGTTVSGLSLKIIDSIFTDIINFNTQSFASLIEARYYLEINAAKLAAMRRTQQDLDSLAQILADFEEKTLKGQSAVDEDMLFHIKIASATKNAVFDSMILILIPDLIKNIVEKKICKEDRGQTSIAEHKKIFNSIKAGNADAAGKAMAEHLNEIFEISKQDSFGA
ncbi:FCD domain-containing protein [Pedobacter petrophilus]|uniref:FCD domain-containing protein n=2 Tax=Pedobacter TaxID=84567 RepID=A0A7K0FZC3_9SPHI|nr:FadR/GntR family transcriptional regulator [Pedobacter petrophilus]MRX76947.1 FCD domain-containing protein [Pedobacter petrophilus]